MAMFKRSAIKKYGNKLLPTLQKRYGEKIFYNASQVRATVYQCDFNPNYLPVGYLLFLEQNSLNQVMPVEFPQLCVRKYKQDLQAYLDDRKYYGYLKLLSA